jgi:hypothetical protein
MSSLLPLNQGGCGTRNNINKRKYVWDNIDRIEYRTIACTTCEEAEQYEREELRPHRSEYEFKT